MSDHEPSKLFSEDLHRLANGLPVSNESLSSEDQHALELARQLAAHPFRANVKNQQTARQRLVAEFPARRHQQRLLRTLRWASAAVLAVALLGWLILTLSSIPGKPIVSGGETPNPNLTPAPTISATGLATPSVNLTLSEALSILPLKPGAKWTYTYTTYTASARDSNVTLTATYQMVETVLDVQEVSPLYIAHVQTQKTLLKADQGQPDLNNGDSSDLWYVIENGQVSQYPAKPDPANLQPASSSLLYRLPLTDSDAWCPEYIEDNAARQTLEADHKLACENGGKRSIQKLGPVNTAAGLNADCYQVTDFFTSGSIISQFCNGVGIVSVKYDHLGTRFGYTQIMDGFNIPSTEITSTATPHPTAVSIPVTVSQVVNVRSGPSTTYEVLGTLQPGDPAIAYARNSDSNWVAIWYPLQSNQTGWVSTGVVAVDVAALPVFDGQQTMTPVAQSTPSPSKIFLQGQDRTAKFDPTSSIAPVLDLQPNNETSFFGPVVWAEIQFPEAVNCTTLEATLEPADYTLEPVPTHLPDATRCGFKISAAPNARGMVTLTLTLVSGQTDQGARLLSQPVYFYMTVSISENYTAPEDTRPWDIHMVDENTGWGSTANSVFRTTDGGKTWLKMTSISIQQTNGFFFQDAQHAWAISLPFSDPGSTAGPSLQITTTQDGGQTWTAGKLPAGPGRIGPVFVLDSKNAWLLLPLGVAAGSEGVAIYHSADGGASWQQLSITSDPDHTTPNGIPLGCLKGTIIFSDANNGFVTVHCYGGDMVLDVTHDGGKTWQRQVVVKNAQLYGFDAFTQNMILFDRQNGILEGGFVRTAPAAQMVIFSTHDGGGTWTAGTSPLTSKLDFPQINYSFLDANQGFAALVSLDDTQGRKAITGTIYHTTDGGQTWEDLHPVLPVAKILQLDFLSDQLGFALASRPNEGNFVLKTTDGGKTWMEMK